MLSEDMAEAANQECPILDKVYEDQTVRDHGDCTHL